MVHVSEYEECKEEILLDWTQANRHGELYCWWHLVLYCAAAKQISSVLSKAVHNNRRHSNYHPDIFNFLVSTAMKYFGKDVEIANIILLMEELWQVGEKGLSTLATEPVANLGEQPFLIGVCIQETQHFSHFFIHMKDLKLPRKV